MIRFEDFLIEMPQKLGNASNLLNDLKHNMVIYDNSKNYKTIDKINDYDLVKNTIWNETKYVLLDRDNKLVLFMTNVVKKLGSKLIPFSYNTQSLITKMDNSNLPKGFGAKFVYEYLITKTNIPLVSDKTQYTGGNILWNTLFDFALQDNLYCYTIEFDELTNVTKENKTEIMKNTFQSDEYYKNIRYVISKQNLNGLF